METVTISKATMSGNVRTLTQIRKEDLVHEACRQLDVDNLKRVLAEDLGLGAGSLGADFWRLDYLLRGKGQASRFIYVWLGP